MAQSEVYDFLKNHSRKWYDVEGISLGAQISRRIVTRSLNGIRWLKEISFAQINNGFNNTKMIYAYNKTMGET